MGYGFKIIIEGERACFTRPELKVERVSYDIPTPSALEGMLKSIYWKPAVKYVIDKIIVFNPIKLDGIRRNEIKEKVSYRKMKQIMHGNDVDACIYASNSRNQRSTVYLKNVKYGVEFHFELTGIRSEREDKPEKKHYNEILRRIEKGQYFRMPCLGCSEFPVKRIQLVDEFDMNEICAENKENDILDLGFMLYGLDFKDKGIPLNGVENWENGVFSDEANAIFYHPFMVNGVVDVKKYKEDRLC